LAIPKRDGGIPLAEPNEEVHSLVRAQRCKIIPLTVPKEDGLSF